MTTAFTPRPGSSQRLNRLSGCAHFGGLEQIIIVDRAADVGDHALPVLERLAALLDEDRDDQLAGVRPVK